MEYLYGIIIIVGLYVILATSFNLIIGYGGLVSIAHPVFFALGAYASAILSRDLHVPVLLAMLAGFCVALIASIALALPSLRVSGDYLMIASIGFQLGVLELIKNVRFTGGPGGFTNIPPFLIRDFGRESYVMLVLAVIQNASILVIPSEWQGFLLYVFLFFAIVFFPNGLRLPRRRGKFGTASRNVPTAPPAESQA